jgi:hypothetical protein
VEPQNAVNGLPWVELTDWMMSLAVSGGVQIEVNALPCSGFSVT